MNHLYAASFHRALQQTTGQLVHMTFNMSPTPTVLYFEVLMVHSRKLWVLPWKMSSWIFRAEARHWPETTGTASLNAQGWCHIGWWCSYCLCHSDGPNQIPAKTNVQRNAVLHPEDNCEFSVKSCSATKANKLYWKKGKRKKCSVDWATLKLETGCDVQA